MRGRSPSSAASTCPCGARRARRDASTAIDFPDGVTPRFPVARERLRRSAQQVAAIVSVVARARPRARGARRWCRGRARTRRAVALAFAFPARGRRREQQKGGGNERAERWAEGHGGPEHPPTIPRKPQRVPRNALRRGAARPWRAVLRPCVRVGVGRHLPVPPELRRGESEGQGLEPACRRPSRSRAEPSSNWVVAAKVLLREHGQTATQNAREVGEGPPRLAPPLTDTRTRPPSSRCPSRTSCRRCPSRCHWHRRSPRTRSPSDRGTRDCRLHRVRQTEPRPRGTTRR